MTISDIRNILEAPYNRKVWKSFIQTQFTNNNLLANDAPLNLGKSDLYTDCYSLGNYAIDDYTKIGIFEIQLADKVNLTRNRVALRNLIKSITQQVAGAMVVFVQGDKWRFSYISKRKISNKETNTVEDKETAPKRYTYLFGKGEKALTASIRFDRLIQKQQGNLYQFLTLNDFEEAFSVERLSKEFFAKVQRCLRRFCRVSYRQKRTTGKVAKYVELEMHPPNFQLRNYFNNDEKQARDFCKRMMGRIVFLYFHTKERLDGSSLKIKNGAKAIQITYTTYSKTQKTKMISIHKN
jgi:adenine-specific DNA-methyltransferase